MAVLVLIITLSLFLPNTDAEEIFYSKAAVTANGKECAIIGKNILMKGGTAADAAIATLFCEGISCSQCMGLGGGFLLSIYIKANKTMQILDAREIAPTASFEDMFQGGNISSLKGGLSVAVPGELRGYEELHNKYGSLPWSELIEPSIQLCEQGFEVTEYLANVLKEYEEDIREEPTLSEVFINPETNTTWLKGDRVKRPKLAETLEIIARDGANPLYDGSLTEQFTLDVKNKDGILSVDDMKNYRPKWLDPIAVDMGSDILYSSPLPGSGHLLAFIINALKDWVYLNEDIEYASTTYWHRIVEVFKYAYAQRVSLGDANFLSSDYIQPILANLTSMAYAEHIQSLISDYGTHNDWHHYGANFGLVEDHGTAHISVLAENGDAVAVTSTINYELGALFISQSTGIILNNEMDDFGVPGVSNIYGLPPSPANFVRAGKRPLSSMVPVIVLDKDDNVRMVTGAAGGTRITTQTALVVLSHLLRNVPLIESVNTPRLHHQLFPMNIIHEADFDSTVLQKLRSMGHNTTEVPATEEFGAVTAISVDPFSRKIAACYDRRRIGSVDGY